MRILHLSDTHLVGSGGPDADGADGAEALTLLLAGLGGLPALDAVVVTGDIADDGSPQAYERARELLTRYARSKGAGVFCTTGNHDDRAAFTRVLGSGHPLPEAVYDGAAGERAAVTTLAGLRLITLDTLVPGKGYGRLGKDQLDWLRDRLLSPAPRGSVLAFHHPPVAMDVEFQRRLSLQDSADLADTIRGTDVRLVLCGHYHLQITARLEQATVSVTPGVVHRFDLTAPPGTIRAVRGPSASLIDLASPHGPLVHTLHAPDPRMGEVIVEADEKETRRMVGELGPPAAAPH